jgi:hypothetical protein
VIADIARNRETRIHRSGAEPQKIESQTLGNEERRQEKSVTGDKNAL